MVADWANDNSGSVDTVGEVADVTVWVKDSIDGPARKFTVYSERVITWFADETMDD